METSCARAGLYIWSWNTCTPDGKCLIVLCHGHRYSLRLRNDEILMTYNLTILTRIDGFSDLMAFSIILPVIFFRMSYIYPSSVVGTQVASGVDLYCTLGKRLTIVTTQSR
mgnify:CR=1 FL=1